MAGSPFTLPVVCFFPLCPVCNHEYTRKTANSFRTLTSVFISNLAQSFLPFVNPALKSIHSVVFILCIVSVCQGIAVPACLVPFFPFSTPIFTAAVVIKKINVYSHKRYQFFLFLNVFISSHAMVNF